MEYAKMSRQEQTVLLTELKKEYADFAAQGLDLDLSRGKPGAAQLDLLQGMLDCISSSSDCRTENGFDCRNYGVLDGIPEAKRMFAELLGIPSEDLFIGGNSSLNLMYDATATVRGAGSKRFRSFARLPDMTGISASVNRSASG